MLLRQYEKRMRIVLDTVVFVRSLIKPNNACGRTIFLHGKKYRLVVSKPLLVELFEVLRRPEIRSKFSPSVSIDYKQILDFLSQAEVVEVGDIPDISRDIKDNKFFGIQVKTARKNSFDTYSFHIRKKSFDRFNQGNIFYILVLRDGLKNSFLILPSNEVEKKIKENAIFTVNNNTGYALNVKFRDQKIYLGNTDHEMSYFLDDWNLIK